MGIPIAAMAALPAVSIQRYGASVGVIEGGE
jgi:hypothetical protein